MGKKDKKITVDGNGNVVGVAGSDLTMTSHKTHTGGRRIDSDGDMYVCGNRTVINGSARTCRSCGGTRGWSTTSQGGHTVTRHSCGAIQ